jgi:hypothetical protein
MGNEMEKSKLIISVKIDKLYVTGLADASRCSISSYTQKLKSALSKTSKIPSRVNIVVVDGIYDDKDCRLFATLRVMKVGDYRYGALSNSDLVKLGVDNPGQWKKDMVATMTAGLGEYKVKRVVVE